MRTFILTLLTFAVLVSCNSKNAEYAVDPEAEKAGWTVLFDGSNLDQWRGFKMDHVPNIWDIEDSSIVCNIPPGPRADSLEVVDLMTRDQFENFELDLEWKISQGGNSGIIYFVQETDSSKHTYETGPEMQVLDNENARDNSVLHRAGDLYDMISTSEMVAKPAGEWNSVRIIANGGKVEHWLNGVKVVEYDLLSPELDSLKRNSKWQYYPEFGLAANGHIALQEHGGKVWFRNIRIKKL